MLFGILGSAFTWQRELSGNHWHLAADKAEGRKHIMN